MKTIATIIGALFVLVNSLHSQTKHLRIESNIDNITVFLTNAEINQSKTISLEKGQTELTFVDITPYLQDNSIRVKVENENVDILTFTPQKNYLYKKEKTAEIKKLNDSIAIINEKIQLYKDELDALNSEKKILNSNNAIGGQNNGVDFNQLKQISQYNRDRIFEINKKISEINRKIKTENELLKKYQDQLNDIQSQNVYLRKEIKVLVETENPVTTKITITYIATNCGWSPSYDIKATDTEKPILLEYRAMVYNNTQIDWNNVEIKLSTYNISSDINIPVITTWFLKPIDIKRDVQQNYTKEKYAQSNDFVIFSDISEDYTTQQTALDTQEKEFEMTINQLSYEFEIPKKQSIASNGKPFAIKLNEKELSATYQHIAVPKLNPNVLLIAKITGWQNLNIVDGPANIFYAGSFVGKSFISASDALDTLNISLGKDSKVIVKRTKINKFESDQIIGSKRKITYSYKFDIKNNHKTDIDLKIMDQIPISQSDEIEIKTLELSNGNLDSKTGIVVWKNKIKPNENKNFEFSFQIKYPKNLQIQLADNQNTQNVKYFNY